MAGKSKCQILVGALIDLLLALTFEEIVDFRNHIVHFS